MQTISKYFVVLLLSLFSTYLDEVPSESDKQAVIYKEPIHLKKQIDCNSLKTHVPELKNYS